MNRVGFIGGKFLPLHQGHVSAIIKAACMVEELYVVLSYSDWRDQLLCQSSSFPYIPSDVRLKWLHQLTKDMENVKVIAVEDDANSDETYDWEQGSLEIRQKIGKPIDMVFSSEKSYEPIFARLYPEAKHILLDSERTLYPISATQIRTKGAFACWEYLPDVVRPFFVKKIVVVGTESCGKSTLVRYLGKVFQTKYVEEYGRTVCEYLGGCDGILSEREFQEICYQQKIREIEAERQANKLLFVDTEAIVSQYYSHLYLGKHLDLIDAIIKTQDYDLWLFLEPDVNWIDDGYRVHGEEQTRIRNNQLLKEMFNQYSVPFHTISGSYEKRLDKAIQLVNKLLQDGNSIG